MGLIKRYNNSPPWGKYLISLSQALTVALLIWLSSLIDLKGIFISLTNIPLESLGIFFYWEIAGIVHTVIVFTFFTNSKELDDKLTPNERKWSIVVIVVLFMVCLGLYYRSLWHMNEHGYNYFLRDSISYAPILIFFLVNLYFFLRHCGNKDKREYFLKMILVLDLPFVISYLLALPFAIYFMSTKDSIHNFLAGVAATVLISSNLVTAAFNAYKERPVSNS